METRDLPGWLSKPFIELTSRVDSLEQSFGDFIMDFFDDPLYSLQPGSGNMAGRVLLQPETTLSASVYFTRRCIRLFNLLSHKLPVLETLLSNNEESFPYGSLRRFFLKKWGRIKGFFLLGKADIGSKEGIVQEGQYPPIRNHTTGEITSGTTPMAENQNSRPGEFTRVNKSRDFLDIYGSTNVSMHSFNLPDRLVTYVNCGIYTINGIQTGVLGNKDYLSGQKENWIATALRPFLTILAAKISLWSPSGYSINPGKYLQEVLNRFRCFVQPLKSFENTRFSPDSFC